MSMNNSQTSKNPYRLMEHMQMDLPSLVIQERSLLELMGGPFPEKNNDLRGFRQVLDIVCGAGSWAMEVARAYPHLEVTGIASQAVFVDYAQQRADAAGLKNVRFLLVVGQERPQLPFPEEKFDLVNTQYLHAWLRTHEWLEFARECWRVTRPGGYVRITETERGQSTSAAFTRLEDLYLQVLRRTGQRLSPDDRHIGAATQLSHLCEEIGWTKITRRAFITDYGKAGDLSENPLLRLQLYTRTFQPLILQEGLASEEELTTLMQTLSEEIEHEDFAANRFLITVSGQKPTKDENVEEPGTEEVNGSQSLASKRV